MKKVILGAALSVGLLSSAYAAQSSGVFVGINAGVPLTVPKYSGGFNSNMGILDKTIKDVLPTMGYGWGIGLDLGYKAALSEDMGLKFYLNYTYGYSYGESDEVATSPTVGTMGNVTSNIEMYLVTANIDYYYDFTDSFGAYIGLGFGYQGYNPKWSFEATMANVPLNLGRRGGFAMPLNIGATYNATDRSQFTLGAKIPLVSYKYKIAATEGLGALTQQEAATKLTAYMIQVGYNYTF